MMAKAKKGGCARVLESLEAVKPGGFEETYRTAGGWPPHIRQRLWWVAD